MRNLAKPGGLLRGVTNRQLLLGVVVLAGAATLFGMIDVVQGAGVRGREAQLRGRVGELERELETLRARVANAEARAEPGLLDRVLGRP